MNQSIKLSLHKTHILNGFLLTSAVFALSGCFGDGKQTTIQPETESGRVIQQIYALITWIDIAIFVVVVGLLLFAVIRYGVREHKPGTPLPKQVHGNVLLESIWTIIPILILIVIAWPTWKGIFYAAEKEKLPADKIVVQVNGHQWWWEFRYPDLGIVTAGELVLPVNKAAVLELTSADVIHAFWVPRLSGKIDNVPGKKNHMWFVPERTAFYYGQCAEFCGTSHANMRFHVRIVSQDAFDDWVTKQKLAPQPRSASAQRGEQLFLTKTCVACHAISGNPVAQGVLGPNLTNLNDRSHLASGMLLNNPENLAKWIKNPQSIKPRALMGLAYKDDKDVTRYKPIEMTDAEAEDLVAYLRSGPGKAIARKSAPFDVGVGEEATVAASLPTAKANSPAANTPFGRAEPLIQKGICWTCHIVPGVANAVGVVGPNLKGLMSRGKIADTSFVTNRKNLIRWLTEPQVMDPGTAMPSAVTLSAEEKETVVDYLLTLK